ncbi:hypothetical protein [Streptomyces sp. NPDC006368]|uniref:hypothetical protein n=1 Tax=Streptomyces sp. NPDC006368 TaxID=3156760 RepID=UPI0033BF3587
MGVRGAVWALANQLGVVAGTPGELLSALLAAPPRAVRVRLPPEAAELAAALRDLGHIRVDLTGPPPAPPEPVSPADLDDPAAVCAADPVSTTAAYEADDGHDDGHGGLRAAWLRAGQSVIRDQDPADRALVLLTALDDTADPRLRPALTELSAGAPWSLARTTRRPCTALTTTRGGRLVVPAERALAVACLADGTRLVLDERGRPHVREGAPTPLTRAVTATLARHPATALAAGGGRILAGDRTGTVHAFGLDGVHQEALHSGRVTALTATTAGAPTVTAPTVAYSGGADGTVRAWRPGRTPDRAPVTERRHPVVALHATADGLLAVAWADGLAELRRLGTGEALTFRPGPRIRAVAVTGDGALVVGLDDALLALSPS